MVKVGKELQGHLWLIPTVSPAQSPECPLQPWMVSWKTKHWKMLPLAQNSSLLFPEMSNRNQQPPRDAVSTQPLPWRGRAHGPGELHGAFPPLRQITALKILLNGVFLAVSSKSDLNTWVFIWAGNEKQKGFQINITEKKRNPTMSFACFYVILGG